MSNDQPNSSPATVDWVKTCINDAKDDINDQTQKAIDKAVSSVNKDLGSVKESLKEASRCFATRDFVQPYITWLPRLLGAAVVAATAALCTLGGWVGRLHGFW